MIAARLLAGTPFFSGLSPVALDVLAARAVERRFGEGEVLYTRGSESRGLFVILEGRVRVVRGSSAGRQHVVHVEGPGGTLGEVPLFEGGDARYPATAIAATPIRCAVLSRDALGASMRADPDVAWLLLRRLAARVRTLVDRLDRLASHDVGARLAEYILTLTSESGDGVVTFGTSQMQVAEELGTVREVVVRELRRLKSDGLLRSAGRGRFVVADLPRLRERAR